MPNPALSLKTLTLSNLNLQKVTEVHRWSQEGVQGWIMDFSKLSNYGDANGRVIRKCQNVQKRSHFFDTFLELSKPLVRA